MTNILNNTREFIDSSRQVFSDTVQNTKSVLKDSVKGAVENIKTAASSPNYEDYMSGETSSRSLYNIGLPPVYNTPSAAMMKPLEERPDYMSAEKQYKTTAGDGFLSGAASFFGQSVQFLESGYKRNSALDDPNYNPLKDPRVESLPEEKKIEHLHRLVDSPNYEYTTDLLKQIDIWDSINKNASDAPGSYFVGAIMGGVFDPLSLIALPMRAWSVARTAATVGGIGAASSVMQSTIDPTYDLTKERLLLDTAIATSVGAGLGVMAKGVGKRVTNNVQESIYHPEKNKPIQYELSSGSQTTGAMYNPNNQNFSRFKLFNSNLAFTINHKAARALSAQTRLESNSIAAFREAKQTLTQGKLFTEGMVEGTEVAPGSIIGTRDTEWSIATRGTTQELDSLYPAYKKDMPVSTSKSRLFDAAWDVAGGIRSAAHSSEQGLANKIRAEFDNVFTKLKDIGVFGSDAKAPKNWLPFKPNITKLEKDLVGLRQDVSVEVRRALDNGTLLKAQELASTGQLTKDATKFTEAEKRSLLKIVSDEVVDQLTAIGKGDVQIVGAIKSRHMNFNELDLSQEFRQKYSSTDKQFVYNQYLKEAYDIINAHRITPDGDVVNYYYNMAKAELDKRIEDIINNPKISESDKNKQIKELRDAFKEGSNDVKDMVDLYTGNYFRGKNGLAKTTNSVVTALTAMGTLGMQVLSNITDWAYVIGKGIKNSSLLSDISKFADDSVNNVKIFKDSNDAKLFGFVYDEWSLGQATRETTEIDMATSTKLERLLGNIFSGYSHVTLFAPLMNFMYKFTSTKLAMSALEGASQILKGTLKQGSKLALEMSQMGIDKRLSSDILDQLKLHGYKLEDGSFYPNIRDWDSKIQLEFMGKIHDQLNSTIINVTNGSSPTKFNDPRFKMFTQFLRWIMTAHTKLFLGSLQKVKGMGYEMSVDVIGRTLADITLGVLGGYARQRYINDNDKVELTPENIVTMAIERSAVLALVGYASNLADSTFNIGASSLLGSRSVSKTQNQDIGVLFGPGANIMSRALGSGLKGLRGHDLSRKDVKNIKQAIPFNNFWAWQWYLTRMINDKY